MGNRVCVFVYGTLADDQILKAVTGKEFPKKTAYLEGYRKLDIPEFYPIIVPDPRASVEGKLIFDVDEETLKHLDDYEDEGNLYYRIRVKVKTEESVQTAFTYIGNTDSLLKSRQLSALIEELGRE